ncbi:MAG: VWA domain-containing protein [Deltaproteobacteria bacterium]|nr:VWA domain-containing protein [Deltaproteobacteria bacterium]MBI4374165.1 VWA domain-containing protein [Deltaproteobacteria bacterium]
MVPLLFRIRKGGDVALRLLQVARRYWSVAGPPIPPLDRYVRGTGLLGSPRARMVLCIGTSFLIHGMFLSLFARRTKPPKNSITQTYDIDLVPIPPEAAKRRDPPPTRPGRTLASLRSGRRGAAKPPTATATPSPGVMPRQEIEGHAGSMEQPEEPAPTGLLTMRDKSEPLGNSLSLSDLFPTQRALENLLGESLPANPNRPRAVLQDPTGAYRRYEDGSTLVRNPELGPYPLLDEGRVDDRITVDNSGTVKGVEEDGPIRETLNATSGASSGGVIAKVLENSGGNVTGKSVQVIFVIDTSKSMYSGISLVADTVQELLLELQGHLAKEVALGVIIFRDNPDRRSRVFDDSDEEGRGIHVLEYPGLVNGRIVQKLAEKLRRLEPSGGEEPAGQAVQKALSLFVQMPAPQYPVSRQVIVISDHEGLETGCGDLSYPLSAQYRSVKNRTGDVTVSAILIPNNSDCGCTVHCSEG